MVRYLLRHIYILLLWISLYHTFYVHSFWDYRGAPAAGANAGAQGNPFAALGGMGGMPGGAMGGMPGGGMGGMMNPQMMAMMNNPAIQQQMQQVIHLPLSLSLSSCDY